MTEPITKPLPVPELAVDVAESGHQGRKTYVRCEVGRDIRFSTEYLESYCFANWEPVIYDTLLLAGAVEFADRACRRSRLSWSRKLCLSIPVHDPALWNGHRVSSALQNALNLLTGDQWDVEFRSRRKSLKGPRQGRFELPAGTSAVIPFSEGLDSRAVAGLMTKRLGDALVRVRLGTKDYDQGDTKKKRPFAAVPYKVTSTSAEFVESSARSRGFKFALISGLAAYLSGARTVLVPESGQGALGPALVTVGQAYPDYRSHPLFTDRMETFFHALLTYQLRYEFPRIWNTKGETLREFVADSEDASSWSTTWSCWQQNRQVSVEGKKRHCGICAACMLRRLSVHAAGLTESRQVYVWENLAAPNFEAGAAGGFPPHKITRKLYQYAVAGVLHLDHLAYIRTSTANTPMLDVASFQLSRCAKLPEEEVRLKLDRLLRQHEQEWLDFKQFVGEQSFISRWVS